MNTEKKYLLPTPGGLYYLVQDSTQSWQKDVLIKLVSNLKTPELTNQTLETLFEVKNKEEIKLKLHECEKLQLIQVVNQEISAPIGHFENCLKNTVSVFSSKAKVLLSDSQGFCIINQGFPTEISEEISVLSADIAIMHKRRAIEINKKLGLNSQAWSIVDASGHSKIGFWQLNIDTEVFVLAIEGFPFFNRPEFITLVWALYLRYGSK